MNFLVVDDMHLMRRIISNVVNSLGFDNIYHANDGMNALSKLHENRIDFVVTDWLMPNMDGLELVKQMRGHYELKGIPVLMITSVDRKESVVEALRAGINDYVAKPFQKEIIAAKIQKIIDENLAMGIN